MPPPGYEPFLRAICADPEDDTVRLVYADWLDENGDPERAEFIRLQIAVPLQPKEFDPRYARAEELRKKNWDIWFGGLPKLEGIEWVWFVRRGFVFGVVASAGKWFVAHREQIFGATPVQNLTLIDAGQGTVERVLAVPETERLTSLTLRRCRIAPGYFDVVTRCPRLGRLRSLTISDRFHLPPYQCLTDDEARALVNTPFLPRLEALHLSGWISEQAERVLLTRYRTVRFDQWRRPQTPPPDTPFP
jgi:uncharacterized protein (TIGR02996 family)